MSECSYSNLHGNPGPPNDTSANELNLTSLLVSDMATVPSPPPQRGRTPSGVLPQPSASPSWAATSGSLGLGSDLRFPWPGQRPPVPLAWAETSGSLGLPGGMTSVNPERRISFSDCAHPVLVQTSELASLRMPHFLLGNDTIAQVWSFKHEMSCLRMPKTFFCAVTFGHFSSSDRNSVLDRMAELRNPVLPADWDRIETV